MYGYKALVKSVPGHGLIGDTYNIKVATAPPGSYIAVVSIASRLPVVCHSLFPIRHYSISGVLPHSNIFCISTSQLKSMKPGVSTRVSTKITVH